MLSADTVAQFVVILEDKLLFLCSRLLSIARLMCGRTKCWQTRQHSEMMMLTLKVTPHWHQWGHVSISDAGEAISGARWKLQFCTPWTRFGFS